MYLFHNNDISELFFVITITTRSSPITMVICFLCVFNILILLKELYAIMKVKYVSYKNTLQQSIGGKQCH